MSESSDLLSKALTRNRIITSAIQNQQLLTFIELLQQWNKVFNLTAITKISEIVYLHVMDSLSLLAEMKGKRCLDVGSGAGFPGIPLAILNPEQQWVLMDKNSKKTRFLTQVIAELGLKNVSVLQTSCEHYVPQECFDNVVARAFSSLCIFVEKTRHLLCQQGILVAMKGKYPHEELTELPADVRLIKVEKVKIKGMDVDRHIVVLQPIA